MFHRIFQWVYTRKGPRGHAKPAGEYTPAGLPYSRAFGKTHFGKYETFPRLRRYFMLAVIVALALLALWFIVESLEGLSIFSGPEQPPGA